MTNSDLVIYAFLFLAGGLFGSIGTLIAGSFNHFVINQFLSNSLLRILLSLFLILFFSFLSSLIGFIAILGFAADENAGDIVPYYLTISLVVSILCTISYYFIKIDIK